MTSGRGRTAIVALAAALACALAGTAVAAGGPVAHAAKKKVRYVFYKTRVRGDGFVTPGEIETVRLSHLVPRARIRLFVEAPPTTPECGDFYFCDLVRVGPVPGTAPFRASGRGRAELTFVMPSTYYAETDPFNPTDRHPVTFASGQSIHIDADTRRRHKRVIRTSFGFTRALVTYPPA